MLSKLFPRFPGTLQPLILLLALPRDRGEPFTTQIGVGKVIKGWDEGVVQLSLGQKAVLTATPDYVR